MANHVFIFSSVIITLLIVIYTVVWSLSVLRHPQMNEDRPAHRQVEQLIRVVEVTPPTVIPEIRLSDDVEYSPGFFASANEFLIKVTNNQTGEQLETRLIRYDDFYGIGHLKADLDNYVAIGIGIKNEWSFKYFFPLPMTVLLQKRVGFGSIIIISHSIQDVLGSQAWRHILRRLLELEAMVLFVPSTQDHLLPVVQTSRIYLADTLLSMHHDLRSRGIDSRDPGDIYLQPGDGDVWPLSQMALPAGADILTYRQKTGRSFSGQYDVRGMYSMSNVGMKVTTWHKVMHALPVIPDKVPLTEQGIMSVLTAVFGLEAFGDTQRGGNSPAWFMDQRLLSSSIEHYKQQHEGVVHVFREKKAFDKFGSSTMDELRRGELDLDLIQGFHVSKEILDLEHWRELSKLLALYYPRNSTEFRWCEEYVAEYSDNMKFIAQEEI